MSSAVMPVGVVTEEEYLSTPAYEHCEFIDGRVVETNMGTKPHAKSQARCARLLDQYFERRRAGYAGTELRCRVTVRGRRRYYQPDVSAVLNDDEPDSRYLDRAPDLVVEVRSPDDTLAEMFRKMEHYFANGARLGWILLPEEKSALILTPNHPVRTATSGDQLDGGKVLPGLRIPVKRLFS